MAATLQTLLDTLPQVGKVTWIGLRAARREPMKVVEEVMAEINCGLVGDRYSGRTGTRDVTLIQAEHLPAISSYLGDRLVQAADLRRNIVISGINLLSLKDRQVMIGNALLEVTGLCHPCSRMEQTLGPGGYNAVRSHGGITARVVESGRIAVGDSARLVLAPTPA